MNYNKEIHAIKSLSPSFYFYFLKRMHFPQYVVKGFENRPQIMKSQHWIIACFEPTLPSSDKKKSIQKKRTVFTTTPTPK